VLAATDACCRKSRSHSLILIFGEQTLNYWCPGSRFGYDSSVSDICIRLAQLSDRDQLVCLREALWPKSSAEEHARELTPILEGKAPVTMLLIILVAEASNRKLAGFLEVDLRSHADGCNPSCPVGYSRVGTLPRTIDTGG